MVRVPRMPAVEPVAPRCCSEGRLPGAAQRPLQVDVQLVDGEGGPEQVVVVSTTVTSPLGAASEVVDYAALRDAMATTAPRRWVSGASG
jgi:xanthine dehydrogenase molybdopterin-binding subunit B